ncbi:hypothetical protein LXL04_008601 [Taraxacum kok-saghyz]
MGLTLSDYKVRPYNIEEQRTQYPDRKNSARHCRIAANLHFKLVSILPRSILYAVDLVDLAVEPVDPIDPGIGGSDGLIKKPGFKTLVEIEFLEEQIVNHEKVVDLAAFDLHWRPPLATSDPFELGSDDDDEQGGNEDDDIRAVFFLGVATDSKVQSAVPFEIGSDDDDEQGSSEVAAVDSPVKTTTTSRAAKKTTAIPSAPVLRAFYAKAVNLLLAFHRTLLPHMLPSEVAFAAAVSALGIENKDGVVIYDGKGIFSAARVWW